MSAERAKRDVNREAVAMAVTNDASQDPTQLRVDPVTLRLLVSTIITSVTSGVTTPTPGRKTVTSAGTAEALVGVSTPCKKVDIVAETDNTGVIVVGDSTVVAALGTRKGIPLYAGDFYSIEIDDAASIYLDSTVSTDGVTYIISS